MTTTIRAEIPSDEDAIEQVTRRAFLSHPHSHQTEQFIIRALRANHALSVSLVAEDGRAAVIRIIGAGYWRKGKAIYERENQIHR